MTVLRDENEEEEDAHHGKPYIIDLSSTNGSYLNGGLIEAQVRVRQPTFNCLLHCPCVHCCISLTVPPESF